MQKLLFFIATLTISFHPIHASELNLEAHESKSVAGYEGSPSACVAGCVNAITGNFSHTVTDLVIPSVDAIEFTRGYSTSNLGIKYADFAGCRLRLGWFPNHRGVILFPEKDTKAQNCCLLASDLGQNTIYEAPHHGKSIKLRMAKKNIKKGFTNAGSNYIGASTNSKNNEIDYVGKREYCTLEDCSGAKRRYALDRVFTYRTKWPENKPFKFKVKKPKIIKEYLPRYLLVKETLPSGNYLTYHYRKDKNLSEIKLHNSAGKQISSARLNYDNRTFLPGTPWGRKSQFLQEDRRAVSHSPEHPTTHYRHRLDLPDLPACTLDKIIQANGMYTAIEYYNGSTKTTPKGMAVKGKKDWRLGRVRTLRQPIGPKQKEIITHSFDYINKDLTEVRNPLGHLTTYRVGNNKRLAEISTMLYNKPKLESFEWGTASTLTGHLVKRTLTYDNKFIQSKEFSYDSRGNVISSICKGNLTGYHKDENSKIDAYRKRTTYNKEFNTIASEDDGRKKVTYIYKPGTNLKTAELTWNNGKICIRKFYDYDENAALCLESIDDGSHPEKDNLTGVTQRTFKKIQNSMIAPVGYPCTIISGYLDTATGEEKQLKRIEKQFTRDGLLSSESYYNANDEHLYTLTYEYDRFGNISKSIDPLGRTTRKVFNGMNNLVKQIGPVPNFVKTITYNNRSLPITEHTKGPDGIEVVNTHQYDRAGQEIRSTNHFGQVKSYKYDTDGNRTMITAAPFKTAGGSIEAPVTQCTYDALGNLVESINPLGQKLTIANTVRGQPYQCIYPDGTIEKKGYTLDGEVAFEIGKNNIETRYEKDYQGRILSIRTYSPQGKLLTEKYKRYTAFHLIEDIDEEGFSTRYTYDGAGRMSTIRSGDRLTELYYDACGNPCEERRYINNNQYIRKTKEYDILKRVISETDLDETGKVYCHVRYEYDQYGNKSKVITENQAGLAITETQYNSLGQPLLSIDPEGNQTHYQYDYKFINDSNQRVLKTTTIDPMGKQQIVVLDTHGRTASTTRLNSLGEEVFKSDTYYDLMGRQVKVIITVKAPGRNDYLIENQWHYNAAGEVIKAIEAVGEPEQKLTRRNHNLLGQLEAVLKPDGNRICHEYDDYGRLHRYYDAFQTFDYHYAYNKKGTLIQVNDLIHETTSRKVVDNHGQLIEEHLAHGYGFLYAYNQLGFLTSITLPDDSEVEYQFEGADLTDVIRRSATKEEKYRHSILERDPSGAITKMQFPKNAGAIDIRYDIKGRKRSVQSSLWHEEINGFDPAGNLLEKTLTDTEGTIDCHYSYDDLYQLKSETGVASHTYLYDSVSNRIEQDEKPQEHNKLNQLLRDRDSQYHYDLNGNLTKEEGDEETTLFEYDGLDRLTKIQKGNQVITYEYDSWNRRLSKTVEGKKTHYLYFGLNEVGSIVDGKIVEMRVLGATPSAEIGATVAIEVEDSIYAPLHDHNGNIACLLDIETGNVADTYRYSAFGEEKGEHSVANPWRFSSKRLDEETGYLYFGRRYYSPKTGRWISADPTGYRDGPNLYAYVLNNPLTNSDLYGLEMNRRVDWNQMPKGIIGGRHIRFECGLGDAIKGIFETFSLFKSIVEESTKAVYGVAKAAVSGAATVAMHTAGTALAIGTNLPDRSMRNACRYMSSRLYGMCHNCASANATEAMSNYELELPDENGIAVIFGNGIWNDSESSDELKQSIVVHSGAAVSALHNESEGYFFDLLKSAKMRVGIQTEEIKQCVKMLKELGSNPDIKKIIYLAHSQGGEVLYYALKRLPKEITEKIYVGTFGSSKMISNDMCGYAVNYINNNDPVPFIGAPLGVTTGYHSDKYDIRFSGSGRVPFGEHTFAQYNKQVEEYLDHYAK